MINIIEKKKIQLVIVAIVGFCLFLIYYCCCCNVSVYTYPQSIYPNSEKHFSKGIAAYGLTVVDPENRQYITDHFDLVVIPYQMGKYASDIKALNSDIKVFAYLAASAIQDYDEYWDEVNIHEDWFLHDKYGNRLQRRDGGWYAMDVGEYGWQNFYANQAANILETYPSLDGIMADEAMQYFYYYDDFWMVSSKDIPESIKDRWYDDMEAFLQHVCSIINKPILPNTRGLEYANITGGIIWEGFLHAPWIELGAPGYNENEALAQINDLAEMTGRGYYYCAISCADIPDNPTLEEIEQAHEIMRYCFCGFLLGINGPNAVFGWETIDDNDNSRGYYPEMDAKIGNPKGDCYHVEGSLYGRDFDHAKVFVNFSDKNESYTVSVNGVEYIIKPKTGTIVLFE